MHFNAIPQDEKIEADPIGTPGSLASQLAAQQKALAETQARLVAVLHALPDLWFVLDAEGRYVDGHSGHPMLLKPLPELKGFPLGHFLPPAQGRLQQEALQRLKSTGQPQRLEYRLIVADGSLRHFEARLTPMPDRQTLFITRDITEVKLAELAMHEKQSAEAANAAKTQFLSRMSHEIRTPLNAVNGFAQLLQLQLMQIEVPQAANDYVRQILHASNHLTGLINDVLDLQQVEAGVLRFRPEPLCLSEEVAQCLAMLAPQATRRGVLLQSLLDQPWPLVADRQRLRQIIMNVGSNAIKYNQAGGMVRLSVECLSGDSLCLSIEDTGPGMSPQQLSRLFQPFERLGRETSNVEGTGLGLIITRSLVEAMGGHMDIRSQPGAGTRVSIDLPVGEQPQQPAPVNPGRGEYPTIRDLGGENTTPAGIRKSAREGAGAAPLRVLYVEDNRINAMLFQEALRPYPQIDLDVAEDGQTALTMARERAPDVLVLDAHLPGMSGFDVLRALRTLPQLADAPAFMCSADAMPEDVARAKAAGFTGYWTKPIDILAVTTELCRLAAKGDNAAS